MKRISSRGKAYIELPAFFGMKDKKYYAIYALVVLGFLFIAFASPTMQITGTVVADFEGRAFEQGEIVTGKLRIDVSDENLPLASIVEIRLGDQVSEIPLYQLLSDVDEAKITDINYYPAVRTNIEFIVTDKVQLSPSIIDYFTGRVAAVSPPPATSVGGSSGGGTDSVGGGVFAVDSFVVFSEGDGSVSFEDLNIIDAKVNDAFLLDGTVLDEKFIKISIIDKDTVEIKSTYNEQLRGFKEGDIVDIPLAVFRLAAQPGEMKVLIKHSRGDQIKSTRVYVPYSGTEKEVFSSSETEQQFLLDFISSSSKECGETVCRIDECVSPNVDAGSVLEGKVEDSLITRIVCSNSCETQERITSCESEEREFKVSRVPSDDGKKVEVADDSGEPVAVLEVSDKRLDISFSQFS